MRVVHKFSIPVDDQWHEVPIGNVVDVHCSGSSDSVLVWVDRFTIHNHGMKLRVFGTGHNVPENAEHVGTAHNPPFVWHVFRELKHDWNPEKA